MKRFFSLILITAITIFISSATVISTHGLDESSNSPAFTMDITAPNFYVAGETVSVCVTINNITAEKGIHYVYGKLYFDAELLGFDFELEENVSIAAFGGYEEWEDFSVLKKDNNGNWYITVSAATVGFQDSKTGKWVCSGDIKDGDISFNFNFVAKENATGDIALSIPDWSVEGSYIDAESFDETTYIGKGSAVTIAKPDSQIGDINGNGEIDSMDYLYLKRAFFKQYRLESISVGDINKNGEIDSMDYLYLKRMFFKQYVIG